jgi:hypothetical protein
MVSENNSIIYTEKTFVMSFHSEQMRVLLRPQIIFKTVEIIYQLELRFLGTYITKNLKWAFMLDY